MLSKSFIRRGVGMVAIEYAFAVINFSARESNTNPNPNYNYMTHTQSQKQHRHFKSRSGHGRHVDKIQQIIHTRTNGYDGWEKCWEEEVTPWDLGKPTPIIEHLVHTHALPNGRALVPGCGSGYDVVAMASPDRYVIGLEISQIAIDKALQISSSSPNSSYFTFLKEDFFTWRPTELFDLIFDYTFFCAIESERRSAWAEQINNLLKPDGELITLMFPIGDHSGGPPYKVSILDYEEVLCPFGFKAMSISDNDLAVEPRKVTYSISLCLFMERGSLKGFLNYTSSWLKLPLTYLSTSLLKLDMLKREGRSLGGGRGCLTNQLYETPLYVLWNKGNTYEIAIIWIGKLIYTSYGLALCTEYICQVVNNKVRQVLINNVAEAHMATGMITILLWGALVSFSLLM